MASQNCKPFEKRRLLIGDDPHGYKLCDHPRNAPAIRAGDRHTQKKAGHPIMDLMDDTPDGDVCCGLCCGGCDWIREFAYIGKHRRGKDSTK
jgi:hypothetical protein